MSRLFADDDILDDLQRLIEEDGSSPEPPLPSRRQRPRRKKNQDSLFSLLIQPIAAGILTGVLVSALILSGIWLFQRGRLPVHTPPAGDMSSDFDETFNANSNGDVETNQEASPEYSLPVYAGDSRGLTIELREPAGPHLNASQLYQAQRAATVSITVYAGKTASYGSGMILTPDGYILTCAHVVENKESCTITTEDGSTYQAEQVCMDEQTDLAVVKIPGKNLSSVTFADSDSLIVGDPVYTIGDPLGPQFGGSLSNGIISGLNRQVSSNSYVMNLIQITAAVNSGNSGGPLFNDRGQVIGVVNMKMSSSGFEASIDNMGLSIPSRTVKQIVEELVQTGTIKRAVLGISCHSINETTSRISGMPEGLWVITINEKSDCAAQGILPGDIVTAVNGTPVNSVSRFKELTSGLSPGDRVTLTIWRDPVLSRQLQESQQKDGASSGDGSLPADESAPAESDQEYHFAYYGDIEVQLVDSNQLAKD